MESPVWLRRHIKCTYQFPDVFACSFVKLSMDYPIDDSDECSGGLFTELQTDTLSSCATHGTEAVT